MIGPQRLSLLDGDVIQRHSTVRSRFGQVVEKIVDAFDFPIDNPNESALQRTAQSKNDIPESTGEACAALKESPAASPSNAWAFSSKKQSTIALVNELLCAWILNATPDGQKPNPLELGWATHKSQLIKIDEDLFHSDEHDESPVECSYICMTC